MSSSSPAATAKIVNALTESIGEEAANLVVERLPTVPADQLATKADLAATEARLIARIDQSGLQIRAELRAEMAQKFEETHKRITDISLAITTQTRTMFFGMIASVVAIIGAMATFTS